MDGIFRRIVELYDGRYDKNSITSEKLLEVLHKMKTDDRISVAPARSASSTGFDEKSFFTVKEWILHRLEFIEDEIGCIFKYYSLYITPELMGVLEDVLKSTMHTHLARVTLQSSDDYSFEKYNIDDCLNPYFELMKRLETIKEQYQ